MRRLIAVLLSLQLAACASVPPVPALHTSQAGTGCRSRAIW